ncbi:hypothetical protein OG858_46975 (plasmid) [Streptomyces europaeiscabiei]|uniref:hypothetical protein n=1 Tax=Streptomyces europaeiscabiei TaxID=146819 RepID=UPI002E81A57F|nr:hypothetical protein [Streptomyces europaeiscabiei]WUD38853.1 hypothetical protein OG858_46975 [Streptomyces europaeiscabiei]
MAETQTATEAGNGVTYVDRQYLIPATLPAPGGITGAQELARMQLSAIAAWGHTVTGERYVEETPQSAEGLLLWDRGPLGIRTECEVDGHAVVIRYDGEIISPDCYTVTVDGQPQEVPSLARRLLHERVRMLALAVHRAFDA